LSKTGNSAGFDFGLETFLTTSDGQMIESPLYYRQAMAELKQAQQNLARKVKGSGGWRKAKLSRVSISAWSIAAVIGSSSWRTS
jgi:putative transposase